MITSAKGRRMLGNISPIYGQSRIMQAIMQAIGTEWDDAELAVEDILKQLFPQTATWGIVYWESLLKLPSNKALPLELRRARVLSKMQTRWPMTKERMERIVRSYSNDDDAHIKQLISEYMFEVHFRIKHATNLQTLQNMIFDTKPAHLAHILMLTIKQDKSDTYWGGALAAGEAAALYPRIQTSLDGLVNLCWGLSNQFSENFIVYPVICSEATDSGMAYFGAQALMSESTLAYPVIANSFGTAPVVLSIGSSLKTSEGAVVYPYIAETLRLGCTAHGVATSINSEATTIYPKGEM